MIIISLSTLASAREVHVATAIVNGKTITAQHNRKSPTPMLARKLAAEGIDPSTLADIVRGNTNVLRKPVALSKVDEH
jgi:hypothetical protein